MMTSKPKRPNVGKASEQLRAAIRASGVSQNEVGRRAEVDSGQLSRFLTGTRGLTLGAAERLAGAVGLAFKLVPVGKKGRR